MLLACLKSRLNRLLLENHSFSRVKTGNTQSFQLSIGRSSQIKCDLELLIGLYHASSMSKIASKSSPARKSQSSAIFDLKSCAGLASRDGTVQHQNQNNRPVL